MSTTEELLECIAGVKDFISKLPALDGWKLKVAQDVKLRSRKSEIMLDEISDIILRDAIRDNPHPLSLDELRERDGKPVWTYTIGSDEGGWELVKFTTICASPWHEIIECIHMDEEQYGCEISTYGKTWLAYDHKPKEAQ